VTKIVLGDSVLVQLVGTFGFIRMIRGVSRRHEVFYLRIATGTDGCRRAHRRSNANTAPGRGAFIPFDEVEVCRFNGAVVSAMMGLCSFRRRERAV